MRDTYDVIITLRPCQWTRPRAQGRFGFKAWVFGRTDGSLDVLDRIGFEVHLEEFRAEKRERSNGFYCQY